MSAMPQKSHPKSTEVPKMTGAEAMAIVESWLCAVEASAPPAQQLHFGIHVRRSLPALQEVLNAVA